MSFKKSIIVIISILFCLVMTSCEINNSDEIVLTGYQKGSISDINYDYYIPSEVNKETGFLLILHGGYMDGIDFLKQSGFVEHSENYNYIVCSPSQSIKRNPELYWNWYLEDSQDGLSEEINILYTISQNLITEFSLNIKRSYVIGFSAGGCEAINVFNNYSDIFMGFASVSGLGYKLVDNKVMAEQLMANGTFVKDDYQNLFKASPHKALIIHGEKDNLVNPINMKYITDQVIEDNYEVEVIDNNLYALSKYSYLDKSVYTYLIKNVSHVYGSLHSSRFMNSSIVNYTDLIVEYFFQ